MSRPTPVRISKQTGFGRGSAQDFGTSPVHLGTSSSCEVRYDATLHPGVAPQHAQLAWNGEAWFLLDGGSSSGTWVNGRPAEAAVPVDGTLSFQLGRDGPRLVAEILPATDAVALPAVEAPREDRFRSQLAIAAGAAVVALLAAGAISLAWKTWFGSAPPQDATSFDSFALQVDEPPEKQAVKPSIFQPVSPALPVRPGGKVESLFLSSMLAYQPVGGGYFWGGKLQASPPPPDAPLDILLPAEMGPSMFLADLSAADPAASGPAPSGFSAEEYERILGEILGPDSGMASSDRSIAPRFAASDEEARGRAALADAMRSGAREQGAAAPAVWCVCVGIDDYESINDLSGCRNDAAALAKVLLFQGLLKVDNLFVLTDAKKGDRYPSAENIRAALKEVFGKAAPQDLVVFLFSGHGMHDPETGETYFATPEFDGERPDETALLGSQLQQMIAASSASKILMMFDSCHSGGLQVLGRGKNAGELRPAPDPGLLETLSKATGHVAVRAATKDEYSIADPRLGHSVFTFVVVKGLTGDADADKDGIVTLTELRPYVSKQTPRLAQELGHDAFHPSFTSGGQAGESGDIPLTFVPTGAQSSAQP